MVKVLVLLFGVTAGLIGQPMQTVATKDFFEVAYDNAVFPGLLLSIPLGSFSQNDDGAYLKKDEKKARPAYLDIAAGINISSFRDFATAPLFYTGTPTFLSLSHLDIDPKRESMITGAYAFGAYHNDFNDQKTTSQVKTVSLNYFEGFQWEKLSSENFNLKIGGQFNTTLNLRENEALFNNDEGLEVISTLFGSIKGTLDVSRKKDKKRLFFKNSTTKRTRTLALKVNIGLLNGSYRNGYSYIGQSSILNDPDFFSGYQLKLFSGYRLNTALDYTIYLPNKNAWQLSYWWDAYKSDLDGDPFEMVSHVLKVSLWFNLK